MGMSFISVGWTTTSTRKPDEEGVARYIDGLSDYALLERLDRLDGSGQYEWEVHRDDDLRLIEEGHEDDGAVEENQRTAQEIRDTLKAGAAAAFDSDARMSNVWEIRGSTLVFTVMGGGSWGDDPFDNYSALVMFLEALEVWPDLKELTDILHGGAPTADDVTHHISVEEN
jgi:hypothetical protein